MSARRPINPLAQCFRNIARIDRREIWEWANEFVDFGNTTSFRGAYDVDNVPWTKEILRKLNDPRVREVTVVMPPQESGKTKMAEVFMVERICRRSAPMAFNTCTNVKAKKWSDTRWQQMLKATRGVSERFTEDRHDKTKTQIIFRDGTFLLIQGAETEGNRQGDSVEVQINDECHLWEKPWLAQMHTRLRAYRDTRKILNISLGANKGSELEERFLKGTQGEWSHHCPKCDKLFQYVFNAQDSRCNIRFDLTKAILREDDSLDLTEFEKTVRVNCQHCGHVMTYDEERLVQMNRRGEYVYSRPNPNAEIVSYHANTFALGRRPWSEIIEPWVRMNLRGGLFSHAELRKFITEELAEFWVDKPIVVSKEIRLGSYTRSEVINPGSWKDEWIRVMSIDNQRGSKGDIPHRWFVCRAFAKDGRARLIDCGRVNEWSALKDRARTLGVPEWSMTKPGPWVVVDRRYNGLEVDEKCAEFKWFGMMGADNEEFVHSIHSPHAGMRMAFSEERYSDIGFGTADQGRRHAVYHLWCAQKVQDALAMLRDGKATSWEVPADIMTWCPEYADHINSHRQTMVKDKKGNETRMWVCIGGHADHLYDCESMLVVLGLMAGVLRP